MISMISPVKSHQIGMCYRSPLSPAAAVAPNTQKWRRARDAVAEIAELARRGRAPSRRFGFATSGTDKDGAGWWFGTFG